MNQLDEGPLARRLAALSLPMPATLTASVLSRASRRSTEGWAHRPAWATAALAACLVIAGLIAGSLLCATVPAGTRPEPTRRLADRGAAARGRARPARGPVPAGQLVVNLVGIPARAHSGLRRCQQCLRHSSQHADAPGVSTGRDPHGPVRPEFRAQGRRKPDR